MPTPCTVTANLSNLFGGNASFGTVTFSLTNIGTGNPIVAGGGGIVPALNVTASANQAGLVTTQLWGNDNINPANTLYSVTFRDANRNEIGPILFSITGSSFNLNTATAVSTVSPPIFINAPNIARIIASGTNLISADFVLTGWGTGATVTAIHGCDMAHRFIITAGTSPSISPTIQLTFHDGAWNFTPVVKAQMTGGSGSVTDLGVAQTVTTYTLTYEGLPTATSTYAIQVLCIGVLN